MIEKLGFTDGKNLIKLLGTVNEIIATVNEQEKKIDFIMENAESLIGTDVDPQKLGLYFQKLKELYEKR